MAENSFPVSTYNSGAVTEAEYERIAAQFSGDGLYGSPADPAPVVAGTGLQVLVKANLTGSLRGFAYMSGGTDVAKSIDANSSGSTRIDRVVMRLDRSTWLVRAAIVKGTPGAGPPALTRTLWDTGVYEELMADVTVPNGATSVTVTPRPVYVGSRIRAANSGSHRLNPAPGDVTFERDTGKWTGWNGAAEKTLYEDSGLINLTLASGWAADGSNTGRLLNGQCEITMNVKRTGSAIAEGGSTLLTTLATVLRPVGQHKYTFVHITGDNNARLDVETTGLVSIRHQWASIPTGEYIRFTFNYQRGGD